MRFLFMVVLPVFCVLPGAGGAAAQQPRALEHAVDAYVAPLRQLNVFSGVVLVARGDSILFEKAYGMADIENGVPLTTRHVFRIASITKSFTLALAGRLAERNIVDLDAPIAAWLPSFPEAGRITMRMLLIHRAGVPNVNSLPYDEEAMRPNTLRALVDSLANLPLDFEPGSARRYSNGGYAVATRILELVTRRSYGDLVREEVLRPVGLNSTQNEEAGDIIRSIARGYALNPGSLDTLALAPFQEVATKSGGGSLVSTARDLHRWALAVGRHAMLRPSTWSDLFGSDQQWIRTGRSPGYNAALVRNRDIIAVVLSNNYAAGMAHDVAGALIALATGAAPRPLPVVAAAPLDADVGAQVQGAYRSPPDYAPLPAGTPLGIRRIGDHLVAHVAGTPVDVVVPQGDRTFLLRSLWIKLTFDAPRDGQSPGFVMKPLYSEGSYYAARMTGGAR